MGKNFGESYDQENLGSIVVIEKGLWIQMNLVSSRI